MRVISADVHRILDFVTVVVFAAAPVLFGLTGTPALLAYVLAGVHLVLTLLTQFSDGGRGVIPFRIHGMIELVVGLVLALLPFVLGWEGMARTFYVAVGVVILIVWALSDYNTHGAGAAA